MASPFTGRLIIEEIEPGLLWRLGEPLRYEVNELGSGLLIEVPAGMVTDGASIPRVLRLLLAVWGTYGRAAMIHDYLYMRLAQGQPHPLAPDRREADRIFREAMAPLGTSTPLRWIMWLAVRLFGSVRNRERSQ